MILVQFTNIRFLTVKALFYSNGNFKGLSFPRILNLWPIDHFLLASLVDAIPGVWCKQLKANGVMTSLNEHDTNLDSFSMHLKGKKIYTVKIQSKGLFTWRDEDPRGRIIVAPYVFCIQFT